MKTIAIFGAGKGLGLSLAKRFGKEDFQVALIARTESKLQELVQELKELNIESSYFVADIQDKEQVGHAVTAIEEKYGVIDVVKIITSASGKYPPTTALEIDPASIIDGVKNAVIGPLHIINRITPKMIERKEGAVLFTSGLSAIEPVSYLASFGIPLAGLRNYIANLHNQLAPVGVYVAHRSIGLVIKEAGSGGYNDPNVIANMWYEAYLNRSKWEDVYPEGVTANTMKNFNE